MKHRHFTQAARRLTALTLALLLALPLSLIHIFFFAVLALGASFARLAEQEVEDR